MSRLTRRFFAILTALVAALVVAAPAQAATLTVVPASGNEGATYKAYQVFCVGAVATDGSARDVAWASDDVRDAATAALRNAGATEADVATAQDAASYLDAHINGGLATDATTKLPAGSLGMAVAKALDGTAATKAFSAGNPTQLDQGWWLVVTSSAKAATSPVFVLVGTADVTVNEKASVPGVEKTVNGSKASSSCVGEALDFQVVGTVAANVASYDTYYYAFEDVPTNLAVDAASVKVVLCNGDATIQVRPDVLSVSDGKLEVGFADLKAAAASAGATLDGSTKVVLTYQAALTASAVLGEPGNPNEVRVTYSASPSHEGRGTTEPSRTTSYAYGLVVHKRDASDASALLAGAKFQIQASDGRYLQADGSLSTQPHEFVTGSDGSFSVSGVGAGAYAVIETAAPDGYDKTDPLSLILKDNAASLVTFRDDLQLTTQLSGSGTVDSADASSGIVSLTIVDSQVPPTPGTPGGGRTPFTGDATQAGTIVGLLACGVVIVCAGLWVRRRQGRRS